MKILRTADIHNIDLQMGWLADQAYRFDLIAVAGDLIDFTTHYHALPAHMAIGNEA